MSLLLRSRVALFGLLAAFLIPLAASSMRGLDHVLTCRDEIRTPFGVSLGGPDGPVVTTSSRMRIDDPDGLCGGLRVDLAARQPRESSVTMVVPVTNMSRLAWRGTVQLRIGGIDLPVGTGEVPPGATVTDHVDLHLPPGDHELDGSLFIGP